MDLQDLVDGMNQRLERERANDTTALTLGGWVDLLASLPPRDRIAGIGEPHSYRGYYSDLAFTPAPERRGEARWLLLEARDCLGQVFEGYKGGGYPMHSLSPVWVSAYGRASGWRLIGLRERGGVWVPALRREDPHCDSVPPPFAEVTW